jgi:transcription elongation factor GreA
MEFFTPEEKEGLEKKLAQRLANRPVIVKLIAEARAHGDLKENAEYHAARDEQSLNEAEIRRLEGRLASAQTIEEGTIPEGIAFLGSVVKLKDLDDDDEELYKLVGEASGTFDATAEAIEVTTGSPMGESLVKARVGDVIKVDLPRGVKRFEVMEIQ